ncbi:MAG TPA: patatin-like phospholipase family protein [Chitinophagaceae bacterium]|nr:patatin-like phospholipase family protein [Chitinophagaceae bacterium]
MINKTGIDEIKSKRIGIVLSGGGVRAIAHLGVLRALEEYNIRPHCLSGTSAGAIAAAFYAAGYPVEEIYNIAINMHFFSPRIVRKTKSGLLSMSPLEKVFAKYLPGDSFSSLKIPLYVAATNINKGKIFYFNKGSLRQALLATACLPVIFAPVEIEGDIYYDGGVMNNLPLEPIENQCDFLIGSHVNAMEDATGKTIKRMEAYDRAYHLLLNHSVYEKSDRCNLFFDPPGMTRFGLFQWKAGHDIYTFSYTYARELLQSVFGKAPV